jgi:hypothetical protein
MPREQPARPVAKRPSGKRRQTEQIRCRPPRVTPGEKVTAASRWR